MRFWTAYAQDVTQLDALPAAERPIAAALVYQRLARAFVHNADVADHATHFAARNPEVVTCFRAEAARHYRKGIESFERLESAYVELASLHEREEELAKSAAVFKRLLHVFPESYEALVWLGNYYLGQDQPEQSEPHVHAAGRLHPRDERTITLQWNQRVTMVRCLTKARQFAAAHHELDEAADHVPASVEPYTLFTMRAGIEWKAKRPAAAQQHLDAALATIEEPTAIWLQMSLTAAHYKLHADVKRDFDKRFKQAIEQPPTSQTAGRLARFFTTLRNTQTNYTGRATQERLFLKYLQRVRPEQCTERDLCDVCRFLDAAVRDRELQDTFITVGACLFPDCARLRLLAGDLEMEGGPHSCDFDAARAHMQRALELARDSRKAEDEEIVERAQRALALLNEFSSRRPFFALDDEDDECADDEEYDGPYADEEDDFGDEYDAEFGAFDDEFGGPPPTRNSAANSQLRHLVDSLPPELAEIFERMAAAEGVSPLELVRRIVETPVRRAFDEHNGDGARGRRRR